MDVFFLLLTPAWETMCMLHIYPTAQVSESCFVYFLRYLEVELLPGEELNFDSCLFSNTK